MKLRLPRYGAYAGRLAFDGDFHIDPKGRKVVSLDGGKTWRYKKPGESSHNARYAKRFLVVQGTDKELVDLAVKHGTPDSPDFAVAHEVLRKEQPHHYAPERTDPHRHALEFSMDTTAASETSHTDAYKEQS